MKNLFLIPTPAETRVAIKSDGFLFLTNHPYPNSPKFANQHIYITNDEEIKEGDWCLDKFSQRWKLEDKKLIAFDSQGIKRFSTDNILGHECKKIILTTDLDLIKDGVQAIDDKFLQWLVDNPSCEEVNVIYEPKNYFDIKQGWEYQIIIPKEIDVLELGQIIPKEEPKQDKIMERFIANAKQETLEEFAEREATEFYKKGTVEWNKFRQLIEVGGKWQMKRSYSEEEVLVLLQKALTHQDDGETGSLVTAQGKIRTANFYSWFEQFKKK